MRGGGSSLPKPLFASWRFDRAIAAYHGLVHCMGYAGRPDLALKVVFAMKKNLSSLDSTVEGDAARVALNVYRRAVDEPSAMRPSGLLAGFYASQLELECGSVGNTEALEKRLPVTKIRVRW